MTDSRHKSYTLPRQGSYTITSVTAKAGSNYPSTGRGSSTTTLGSAHWTALGLTSADIEVEICGIVLANNTIATITELKSGGAAHIFPSVSNVAGGGTNAPMSYQFAPGCGPRFQEGFAFTLTNAGGTIMYKIHVLSPA